MMTPFAFSTNIPTLPVSARGQALLFCDAISFVVIERLRTGEALAFDKDFPQLRQVHPSFNDLAAFLIP